MLQINFDELISRFRYQILLFLVGIIFIGVGVFISKSGGLGGTKVEILETATSSAKFGGSITVEIEGAVITPGVYKLAPDARIDDLLIISGGFSDKADRDWTDRFLNRAAKLTDGQKLYIPEIGEQTLGVTANQTGGDQSVSSSFSTEKGSLVNINAASLSQLDKLPGIGPVYGQSIIDHRPYSTNEDLVKSGAIKQNVYDKIKDLVTVY